jgi:hypothetical protein
MYVKLCCWIHYQFIHVYQLLKHNFSKLTGFLTTYL